MREQLRSSEGALRSMENVPGGFETVKGTFNKLERPSPPLFVSERKECGMLITVHKVESPIRNASMDPP